jgi:hypothetical protein
MKKINIVIIGTIILLLFIGVCIVILPKSGFPLSFPNQNSKSSEIPEVSKSPISSPTAEEVSSSNSVIDNTIPLEITSLQNNTTVSEGLISLSGKTAPFADVIINDIEIKADPTGLFSQSIQLDEGENYISIVSYTDTGAAEKEIEVTWETNE